MKPIKVVLVDDHPLVLQGFEATLDNLDAMEVVGTAGNAEDGERVILETKPDVALLDIMLPGVSGLQLMKQLKDKLPTLEVVFMTASDSDLYLVEALRYGAAGYLSKDSSVELIELTVRAALARGVVLGAPLVSKAFGLLSGAASSLRNPGKQTLTEMTTKEIDVLRMISQGKSDKQIREELASNEQQVREYVLSLRKKLGTKDRITTALEGMRLGLVH